MPTRLTPCAEVESLISPRGLKPAAQRKTDLLRRFIEAYWLRPENALWMTLRGEALSSVPLHRPSIDLSCGDGVFSFLHCGGRFDPAFDVFTSVAGLDRRQSERGDMFDHVRDDYRPPIVCRPTESIDVGTDCKSSMLAKADRLRFYDRLVEHDHNHPLPFGDETFETVYCNAAYWVTNIDEFLSEIRRITRPGGTIILQVKLESMRRYTLSAYEAALGRRFLEIIGRGRLECWPTLADRSTWESRFARGGLTIKGATPFVTATHAHLWDIGLRPIAPLLVRMANGLTPATRNAIKADWVELFCELLEPFCDPALDLLPAGDEPAEIQYVLQAY